MTAAIHDPSPEAHATPTTRLADPRAPHPGGRLCAWPLFSPRSPLSPSPYCSGSLEAQRLLELEVEPSPGPPRRRESSAAAGEQRSPQSRLRCLQCWLG